MDLEPHIEKFTDRLRELERELGDPRVFGNPRRAQELGREHGRLKKLVEEGSRWLQTRAELAASRELATGPDAELAALARDEIARLEVEVQRLARELQAGLVPPDPTDSRNTVIEIRAGAGGNESALFAGELYRMYTHYADVRGWRLEALSSAPATLGGFKEIIFSLAGEAVYRRLKFESGVHRVQRVPATEASGRIHTSTCTVAVLPEAEEVDVEIKPEEIEITVARASGPGGQGVNTTDSAVQIHHLPTGLIVRCADERSQQKNKAKALKVLRSRLLDRKVAEEKARYAAERKSQVGTGERNERIRTYNFPQNRVTDHRINLTVYNLPVVLEGGIDPLVEPLLQNELETKLAAVQM